MDQTEYVYGDDTFVSHIQLLYVLLIKRIPKHSLRLLLFVFSKYSFKSTRNLINNERYKRFTILLSTTNARHVHHGLRILSGWRDRLFCPPFRPFSCLFWDFIDGNYSLWESCEIHRRNLVAQCTITRWHDDAHNSRENPIFIPTPGRESYTTDRYTVLTNTTGRPVTAGAKAVPPSTLYNIYTLLIPLVYRLKF